MLTSAFIDNRRSIRSLTRIGFKELSIRALAPDNDRIFFLMTENAEVNDIDGAKELVDYYAREKLSLKFPSLGSTDTETISTTPMVESL